MDFLFSACFFLKFINHRQWISSSVNAMISRFPWKKVAQKLLITWSSRRSFILTSKKMEAAKALDIYRDRDSIEKMFRMLKSGMEFDHAGVQSRESLESKVFLTFIAAIVRNEIFHGTKELRLEDRRVIQCQQ